jgi:5'-nucleotidase
MKTINKPVKITLAHINDTHSYFEPQSLQLTLNIEGQKLTPYVSNGGFARIATRAQQLKQQAVEDERGFLFLHAGDCFQGTLYFSLFKGKANADLLNALNIDAMALGNHELDMGNEPVAHFLDRIQFPLLVGNWDLSQEREDKENTLGDKKNLYGYQAKSGTARCLIREVSGERIAIFGLSLENMASIANPDPDTPFVSVVETAIKTVEKLHSEGINKIILLSHLGYDMDIRLAEQVSGISLIVGGHTHTLMGDFSSLGLGREDEYGIRINDTYIVQSGSQAQALGHCHINFAEDGSITEFSGKNELLIGRRVFMDASLATSGRDEVYEKAKNCLHNHSQVVVCRKSPEVQHVLQNKYQPQVRELQQTVIGQVGETFRHVRIPDAHGPSDIAPMVAESFVHMMNKNDFSVDFAIHNAGGVRTSLYPGNISVADIAGNLLPFAIPVGVYKIKGKHIVEALEGAINNATNNGVIGTGAGSYPYTYNLDFSYYAEKPLGQRIADLAIYQEEKGWQPIDPESFYLGASSAYTMKGKEGYDGLLNMEKQGKVTRFSMADCFIDFITDYPERLAENENSVPQLG